MTGFIILVVSAILFGIAFFVFFAVAVSDDGYDVPVGLFVASIVCLVCCIIFIVLAAITWEQKPDCIKKQYDNHVEKVDYATKELQKFLIDHPEFKMEEEKWLQCF